MTDLDGELTRAARALDASGYDSGEPLVDLYDLICDLCHLADELGKAEVDLEYRRGKDDAQTFCLAAAGATTWGEYAAQMGLRHYLDELAE